MCGACDEFDRREAKRAWIADLVKRNGQDWITGHHAFLSALGVQGRQSPVNWAGVMRTANATFVTDPERRGFLLVVPMTLEAGPTHHIYFALVDEPHRQKGVLRGLVAQLDTSCWYHLEASRDGAAVWEHLGFTPCSYGVRASSMNCEYEAPPAGRGGQDA